MIGTVTFVELARLINHADMQRRIEVEFMRAALSEALNMATFRAQDTQKFARLNRLAHEEV